MEAVGQFRDVFQGVDLAVEVDRGGEVHDQLIAVVGEAVVEAFVLRDGVVVEFGDFSGEDVGFGLVRGLVDADLEFEVGGLDCGRAVFAAVVKFPAFVAEEGADVAVEAFGGRLHVGVPGPADEALGGVMAGVRLVVVLLEASELADATGRRSGEGGRAVVWGGLDCCFVVNG